MAMYLHATTYTPITSFPFHLTGFLYMFVPGRPFCLFVQVGPCLRIFADVHVHYHTRYYMNP
jgi:hypothetical protein